jgi:hypothetical protein
MDELLQITETAERTRVKLANREAAGDNAMVADMWQAIGMLAQHIMALREQLHARK